MTILTPATVRVRCNGTKHNGNPDIVFTVPGGLSINRVLLNSGWVVGRLGTEHICAQCVDRVLLQNGVSPESTMVHHGPT